MRKQVTRHLQFLSLLINADDRQREALLKSMNNDQFKILLECIYNVLYGSISISSVKEYKFVT